jgi:VacB/RNase II family 3'-5' exoribonuclease
VIEEAERVARLDLGKDREDLRHLPIVAIDPADARDHDDAVWATPDDDPKNEGGWKAIVAIADVSFYVRPGSALDREARRRGNSVYFPDRVVPMLPEILSADVCSLKEGEDRAALACHLTGFEAGRDQEMALHPRGGATRGQHRRMRMRKRRSTQRRNSRLNRRPRHAAWIPPSWRPTA